MSMNSIASFLENRTIERVERKSGEPRCERDELLEETARLLNVPIKRAAAHVKGWPLAKIRDRLSYCRKEGKNPAALWWHLYKKK